VTDTQWRSPLEEPPEKRPWKSEETGIDSRVDFFGKNLSTWAVFLVFGVFELPSLRNTPKRDTTKIEGKLRLAFLTIFSTGTSCKDIFVPDWELHCGVFELSLP
jgi:hypothetical protein